MNYYKNLMNGAVVRADTMPTDHGMWRVATEREYLAFRARVARAIGNLEKAVAYKARLLGEKV